MSLWSWPQYNQNDNFGIVPARVCGRWVRCVHQAKLEWATHNPNCARKYLDDLAMIKILYYLSVIHHSLEHLHNSIFPRISFWLKNLQSLNDWIISLIWILFYTVNDSVSNVESIIIQRLIRVEVNQSEWWRCGDRRRIRTTAKFAQNWIRQFSSIVNLNLYNHSQLTRSINTKPIDYIYFDWFIMSYTTWSTLELISMDKDSRVTKTIVVPRENRNCSYCGVPAGVWQRWTGAVYPAAPISSTYNHDPTDSGPGNRANWWRRMLPRL